ncbi:MAG: hypothetical protein S0880_17385 [Actinomycetota bacterium]|nr:hypothetical protein [Actinomycetota bacterium]
MIRKRLAATSLVAATAVIGVSTAGTAGAGVHRHTEPVPIDVTVLAETLPTGYTVTGLAVEYDRVVDIGDDEIDESAFDIQVELAQPEAEPTSGTRTVVDAYTADTPGFSDEQAPGSWVILELDPADELALAAYNDGDYTQFYDLIDAYEVTQVAEVGDGWDAVSARPKVVVSSSDVLSAIVDDYDGEEVYETETGLTLPYRYFTPETVEGELYPLVVTLHGYGESGTNNFSQIAGNQLSSAFADPARQERHPAYVLSPQANPLDDETSGAWWEPEMQQAVLTLVNEFIADRPDIDTSRVYLSGVSMGSYGSWSALTQASDLFAGALLICGAGDEEAALAELGDTPIWAVHAIDDATVLYDAENSDFSIFQAFEEAGIPVTWSEWSGSLSDEEGEAAAAEAVARATEAGSDKIFTTFPEGTTPILAHLAWIPVYTNDVIIDWLFAQGGDADLQ